MLDVNDGGVDISDLLDQLHLFLHHVPGLFQMGNLVGQISNAVVEELQEVLRFPRLDIPLQLGQRHDFAQSQDHVEGVDLLRGVVAPPGFIPITGREEPQLFVVEKRLFVYAAYFGETPGDQKFVLCKLGRHAGHPFRSAKSFFVESYT